jgi:cyclic beta-1,2-glucan synthetase
MAHHQGMSLLAFAHVLLDQPMQRRFMSDPLARATELLLQERVPKKGATLHPHAAEVSAAARPPSADAGAIMRVFTDPNTPIPEVHLLSNGRYHVMATHAGGSYSRWRDLAVTRWREDATTDGWGTFIYLRDRDSGKYWSTAYQPTLRRADHYEAIFVQGARRIPAARPGDRGAHRDQRVPRGRRRDPPRHAHQPVVPHPSHRGDELRGSGAGAVECRPGASRLQQSVRADRNPARAPGDPLHPAAPHAGRAGALDVSPAGRTGARWPTPSYETDRARFIGRGRTAANPAGAGQQRRPIGLSNTRARCSIPSWRSAAP